MIKPFHQEGLVTQYCSDALRVLLELKSNSVDLLATDPPYGIGFMGKDWDKALPDKRIWAECFRVLKDGAFAFVMSIPRADCLSRMIISLEDAGFWVNFTPIFWAYASGFPKAQNIGKAMDKRLGAEREVIGHRSNIYPDSGAWGKESNLSHGFRTSYVGGQLNKEPVGMTPIEKPTTPQAKALDGSYGGFQPKPAVEVIIVAMKPLSEKTFVDQALKNRKGITWLDEGRIPYESENAPSENRWGKNKPRKSGIPVNSPFKGKDGYIDPIQGRFPANLLVSYDVLNDGRTLTSPAHRTYGNRIENQWTKNPISDCRNEPADSGSFSRYFDLDKWFAERIKQLPKSAQKTFPFLIVPKASKSEKNKGLDDLPQVEHSGKYGKTSPMMTGGSGKPINQTGQFRKIKNNHPSVKPVKLMSYLITLGSRAGDTVLDPFMGSGTTGVACQLLNRKFIGIDNKEEYCEIAAKRCSQSVMELRI